MTNVEEPVNANEINASFWNEGAQWYARITRYRGSTDGLQIEGCSFHDVVQRAAEIIRALHGYDFGIGAMAKACSLSERHR